MRKLISLISIASLVLVISVALSGCVKDDPNVGGAIHNTQESFDAGIAVNGTQVISSTRGISATTFSGTTISATNIDVDNSNTTSTVSVGNTGVGKLCLYNGASYSIISFSSNSTSTSIATSTTCQ
jgi:hypothetical protein